MVLWQHTPGKDAQFHTPHPLPQPTLKLKPLQMKLLFCYFGTSCLFSVFRGVSPGGREKSYFPLVSATLMIFVLVVS